MHALHFGAGYFGLGFACALLARAGVPVMLLNRKTDQSTKDDLDTVSRTRRNELLQENSSYFVNHRNVAQPSDSDFQSVELEGVLLYDSRNADEIADTLGEYDDDLIVTFSLRRIENYAVALGIVARIVQIRARRACRTKIFLMACENGIESGQVASHFRQRVGSVSLNEPPVIFLQTSVDRICTRLDSWSIDGREWLVVEAESHARWYIENRRDIEELKDALVPLGDSVAFTDFVAQERFKKLSVTNGAHALIALHCWYLGIEKTDEFLNGTSFRDKAGTSITIDSVQMRRDFLHELIRELFVGTRLFLMQDNRLFCETHMSDLEQHRFATDLVDRLSYTPDSVARIIKNFVRPEPADKIQERHIEFFRSVRARIEEPVLALIQHERIGPPCVCRVLVEILDLLGRVDQFRNMPLYTSNQNLH